VPSTNFCQLTISTMVSDGQRHIHRRIGPGLLGRAYRLVQ
jgi:hypothetical protein